MSKSKVRVRFAPSPTGSLHIGGVRTALYNYLLAKKHSGTFIIRIEDTDQSRFVPGAEAYILNSLEWVGLVADEGPVQGGPFGPYRQSERMHLYAEYAQKLVASGHAYYAFDTSEELDAARASHPDGSFQYNAATRIAMRNSLSLSEEETRGLLAKGAPFVIRLKVPKKEEIRLHDLIRGWVMVHSSTLDDKVLLKSDGMPTYHLANVVDDYLMEISHVIRGEEWLPSAPTHVLLYRFLGWEEQMPEFAHLPLLLKPSGDGKLSKRDGEAHGFPVFPLAWKDENRGITIPGFKEEGYLPEALINFLALLGWNPGTEQEMFTMEQLIEAFSLERIGKAGTRFDIQKARWFNQHYLQLKDDAFFSETIENVLLEAGLPFHTESLPIWVGLVKSRSTFLADVKSELLQVCLAPKDFDVDLVSGKWTSEARTAIETFVLAVPTLDSWEANSIKAHFFSTMEAAGLKPGKFLQVLRLVMTGKGAGPDLMILLELLGKEACVSRMKSGLEKLPAF